MHLQLDVFVAFSRVALIAEEATKYLAKRYNFTSQDITFGLPLADVRGKSNRTFSNIEVSKSFAKKNCTEIFQFFSVSGTDLGKECLIKVDYPCQPGKYRAYNGYCNNVQNPNWGVANRRYLRYSFIIWVLV